MLHCAFIIAALASLSAAMPNPAASSAGRVALVTGATGRTGSLVYKQLVAARGRGNVRGLVMNLTTAKQVLGCSKCDASEGIFLGDVTKPATLVSAVDGVSDLLIAVGSPENANNKLMENTEFFGVMNQVSALLNSSSNPIATNGVRDLAVVLCSSMGTTYPTPPPQDGGPVLFYKLQAEAFLGSVGVRTAVVKPCGLVNGKASVNHLKTGHNDELLSGKSWEISRTDVARVMVAALDFQGGNLRFDLCTTDGPATPDAELQPLLTQSQWPWMR